MFLIHAMKGRSTDLSSRLETGEERLPKMIYPKLAELQLDPTQSLHLSLPCLTHWASL